MMTADTPVMERSDAQIIADVRTGKVEAFESLVTRHQPRVFATARRYARSEDEVEDIVQEVFIKAFKKLDSFRGEAPFEHWLMRLAVRTCYDFLRRHQRSRETCFTTLTRDEFDWLEQFASAPEDSNTEAEGARKLVERLLQMLSPPARLVITLQEIEGKSIKEISAITGWSLSLVKVRAFRARKEMQKHLRALALEKYL